MSIENKMIKTNQMPEASYVYRKQNDKNKSDARGIICL